MNCTKQFLILFLTLFIIIGGIFPAMGFLAVPAAAAEAGEPQGLSIAVGLLFGANVDVAFKVTTANGFIIGKQDIDKYEKNFTPLYSIGNTPTVSVMVDANMGRDASNNYFKSSSNVVVGGYNLELGASYENEAALRTFLQNLNPALQSAGIYAFPAYIGDKYRVRIGAYATQDAAAAGMAKYKEMFPGADVRVVAPSATGTMVIVPGTGKILFEYDCGNKSFVAVVAQESPNGVKEYLKTPADRLYDGIFAFKRYTTDSVDGVALINVLPLEDYVMGVLPYEISNSWPIESQKAFAIAVRTYVLSNMGRYWTSYGFNVCNTTSSQVYRGVGSVNDRVREAVRETAGIVLTYNDKLAQTFYCSSTGGSTVGTYYVWGGDGYPYLDGKMTPWEDYMNHANGFWSVEISPAALLSYLNGRGYTTLKGEIASIKIDEHAPNSTYIYKLTITDSGGRSVTLKGSEVRSALTAHVKSANFVVGKGSVDYTVYSDLQLPSIESEIKLPPDATITSLFASNTALGRLIGATPWVSEFVSEHYKHESYAALKDAFTTKRTEAKQPTFVKHTAYADTGSNFIFVGKGYGHGVGLSQWGVYDLTIMGVKYKDVLKAYCTGTETDHYSNVMSY